MMLTRQLIHRLASAPARRQLSTLHPTIYTAISSSTGSRADGASSTLEGNILCEMGLPKQMGGLKGPAGGVANPEQLFGMGYSTCFLSALGAAHATLHPDMKPLPKDTAVRAKVSIGKGTIPGYQLAVELEVLATPLRDIGLNDAQMKELVKQAHELCPYSRATRGNIELIVRVVKS